MDGFSDGAAVAVCRLMGVSAAVGVTCNFENDDTNYMFTFGGLQAYANVRGYRETRADNPVEGFALCAVVAIPLGSRQSSQIGAVGKDH